MKNSNYMFRTGFLLLFLLFTTVKAEVEPNNSYQQASTIAPNSSDSGALNEATQTQNADNYDWWKIIIPEDGVLTIETTSDAALDLDITIYDGNGSTYFSYSSNRTSTTETAYDHLLAGTYYVLASRYIGTGSYSIKSTFVQASLANDTEPNDSYSQGINLSPNSSTTGHLGFFNADKRDYYDWWKIVIPEDGVLTIETVSDATLDLDLTIYDGNGSTYFSYSSNRTSTTEIAYDHLLAGTYYVLANNYSGYGSYTIKSIFVQASLANDTEPNDSYSQGINLSPNSSTTGHLGFFNADKRDYYDWWKIVIPEDGVLTIETVSDATLDLDLTIYDGNGSTYFSYGSTRGTTTETASDHLLAGTYYVLANNYSGYGSYTIKSIFVQASLANDPEPNDNITIPINILTNSTYTGHLGFFNATKVDYYDYYTFTLPNSWDSLYIRTDSDSTLDVDLTLYNSPSTYVTYSSVRNSTKEILAYKNDFSSSTYYINVNDYSGYGSYAIKISNTYPNTPLTDVKKDETEIIPTSFSLSQNFPNPFNPATTIKYDLPQNSDVTLKVYDVLGKEVANLVNENEQAGTYTVNFVANNLASGIYFYRINAGSFSQTKKFILMK